LEKNITFVSATYDGKLRLFWEFDNFNQIFGINETYFSLDTRYDIGGAPIGVGLFIPIKWWGVLTVKYRVESEDYEKPPEEPEIPGGTVTPGDDNPEPPVPGQDFTSYENRTQYTISRLNPILSANIASDNRNDSNPKGIHESTQEFNNLLEDGDYYGIPTHKTQYAQILTATRNLFILDYVKVDGERVYNVSVRKGYNTVSWSNHYVVQGCGNSGELSAPTSSSGGEVADGIVDTRWRHDGLPSHGVAYFDNDFNGQYRDERGEWQAVEGDPCLICGGTMCSMKCNWSTPNTCNCGVVHCPGGVHIYNTIVHYKTVTETVTDYGTDEEGNTIVTGSHQESHQEYDYTEYIMCTANTTHTHEHGCSICGGCTKHNYCTGHSPAVQSNENWYWCNYGSCPGHERIYQGTMEYQCEVEGGCIHKSTVQVTRTYLYQRKYSYYEIESYSAYRLSSAEVYNATLTNSGHVTLNGYNYTLRSECFRPNEIASGWSAWSNYHIKDPEKIFTKIHNFNEYNDTPYKNQNIIVDGATTYQPNWNDHFAVERNAKRQAIADLCLGIQPDELQLTAAEKVGDQSQIGALNASNKFWLIGENCAVLKARNDFLYHDSLLMNMYMENGLSVFSEDGLNASTLSSYYPLPTDPNLLTNCGEYRTNRENIKAITTSPEDTVPDNYETSIQNIRDNIPNVSIRTPTTWVTTSRMTNTNGGLSWNYLYTPNVLIPTTITNNIYGSYIVGSYTRYEIPKVVLGEDPTLLLRHSEEVNDVIVDTPVYVKITMSSSYEDTQVILGSEGQTSLSGYPLELDKEYVAIIETDGQHRYAKGYNTREYAEWVKYDANTDKWYTQIEFPFDIYYYDEQIDDYVFFKENTWFNLNRDLDNRFRVKFKVPVWTIEKNYATTKGGSENPADALEIIDNAIVCRTIAENDPRASDGTVLLGRYICNKQTQTPGMKYEEWTGIMNQGIGEDILYDEVSYDYRAYDFLNVNVVGKVYDFKFEYTDDPGFEFMMKDNVFSGMKSNELPFGQYKDNMFNPAYEYGLKLGYKFKFSLQTKGTKSTKIKINPIIYYVDKWENNEFKEVDVYYENDGSKYEKFGATSSIIIDTNIRAPGELPSIDTILLNDTRDVYNAYSNDAIIDPYKSNRTYASFNLYNKLVNIGSYGGLTLTEDVRLRKNESVLYSQEKVYGNKTPITIINNAGSKENFVKSISKWYGEFRLPSSSVVVDKGVPLYNTRTGKMQNIKKDGYLVVFFEIITEDFYGDNYLSYQLPNDREETVYDTRIDENGNPVQNLILNNAMTQWKKEGYGDTANGFITLPNGKIANTNSIPNSNECAAVVIYELLLNNDGTVVGPN